MTAKEYAQKLFGGQLPPPTDLATLSERLDHFRGLAPSNLGPLPPPFPRCPGVYNKGCGGQLNYVKPHEYNTAPFWGCEKYNEPGSKACSYRFYPSERVEHCQMDIVIAGEGVIEVCPSPGAEDAVKACGGVATILTVIGVDMGMALEQNSVRMSISPMKNLVAASDRRDSVGQSPKGSSARPGSSGAGHAAVVQGVRFPLSSYNEVKGTLAGCKLAGKALLGKGIPKQTLQAFK